jgi:HK97 family phage portal protein
MKFKIPFTNVELNYGRNEPEEKLRGLYFTRRPFFNNNTETDMVGVRIEASALYSIYKRQSDVYACVRKWRQTVGKTGYSWVDPNDAEVEVSDKVQAELDEVLGFNQGDRRSFTDLKSIVMRDLGVCANAYATYVTNQAETKVLGLQVLDPRSMAVVIDKHGTLIRYIQRIQGQEAVLFLPEEIIHWKDDSDPEQPVFGFSRMESILWEAKTDLSAMVSNYTFFDNDAKPATVFIMDGGVDETELQKIKDKMDSKYKGAENRNKTSIMAGVKEIKTLGVSQRDMEFIQQRKFSTAKICAAYGVPEFVLGHTEAVNNNNGIELKKDFIMDTIIPLEHLFAETLNSTLLVKMGLEEVAKFKFNPQVIYEASEVEKRASELYKNGMLTLRQVKNMMGIEITTDDERQENFDSYILHSGAGAVLLEDVGIDPILIPNEKPDDNKS